jgi:5'-nucleotidase/UDP-sugar diphosphatase
MKNFRIIWAILFALLLFAGCATVQKDVYTPSDVEHTLTVLHTNDHHGHPLPFFNYPCPGQGGLPARATLVNQVRAETSNVLLVDAGDFNTGRPESNFFQAEPDIKGYNYIQYDALAMGNHEFDNNWEIMQKQIAMSEFPWLCANAKKDGKVLENVKPYIIKEYDGFKVAVIGLLDSRTSDTGNPEHIKGIVFEDEVKVANELVPMLKKQADIVIAVVHMGLYDETDRGSRRLAAQVPGLALIVDGHTHSKLDEAAMVKNEITGKQIPIVQAKDWGLIVGRADLSFKSGEVTGFNWSPLPVNIQKRVEIDGKKTCVPVGEELVGQSALEVLLKPYNDKVEAELSVVIGSATDAFKNDDTRKMETALGSIVSDSQLWYMKKMGFDIDFAFQNGGGIRATLGSGEIKKKTIYEILPFDNSITMVALKGTDVVALFDKAAGNVGKGAMAQVSDGVSFTINTATQKAENLTINGKPVDPEKTYQIALNSYLAAGGDGYKVFKNKVDFYDSSNMQRDAFIDYVVSLGGTITPKTYDRITVK